MTESAFPTSPPLQLRENVLPFDPDDPFFTVFPSAPSSAPNMEYFDDSPETTQFESLLAKPDNLAIGLLPPPSATQLQQLSRHHLGVYSDAVDLAFFSSDASRSDGPADLNEMIRLADRSQAFENEHFWKNEYRYFGPYHKAAGGVHTPFGSLMGRIDLKNEEEVSDDVFSYQSQSSTAEQFEPRTINSFQWNKIPKTETPGDNISCFEDERRSKTGTSASRLQKTVPTCAPSAIWQTSGVVTIKYEDTPALPVKQEYTSFSDVKPSFLPPTPQPYRVIPGPSSNVAPDSFKKKRGRKPKSLTSQKKVPASLPPKPPVGPGKPGRKRGRKPNSNRGVAGGPGAAAAAGVKSTHDNRALKPECPGREYYGCWTCRIRHKACPADGETCSSCRRLRIECDMSPVRPIYLRDPAHRARRLQEIYEARMAALHR